MFKPAVFDTFPNLETDRCLLRAFTPEDAPDFLRIMSDPQVTRYLGRHPMTTLEQAAERIKIYQDTFKEQTGIVWLVCERDSGLVIGNCLLWNLSKTHSRAELGYTLHADMWGKGIMTEVGSAIVSFGFTSMGLHSVEAHIDPENTGSRKLLEKLGFVQEGYFRENFYDLTKDAFTDTAVFSLLKSAWVQRTGKP